MDQENDSPAIAMQPVQSSQISEVGYNPETKDLHIRFAHGNSLYVYSNVPKETFDGMMSADSIGRYHGQYIKYGFPYRRLS